jgi:hypothetical protein
VCAGTVAVWLTLLVTCYIRENTRHTLRHTLTLCSPPHETQRRTCLSVMCVLTAVRKSRASREALAVEETLHHNM